MSAAIEDAPLLVARAVAVPRQFRLVGGIHSGAIAVAFGFLALIATKLAADAIRGPSPDGNLRFALGWSAAATAAAFLALLAIHHRALIGLRSPAAARRAAGAGRRRPELGGPPAPPRRHGDADADRRGAARPVRPLPSRRLSAAERRGARSCRGADPVADGRDAARPMRPLASHRGWRACGGVGKRPPPRAARPLPATRPGPPAGRVGGPIRGRHAASEATRALRAGWASSAHRPAEAETDRRRIRHATAIRGPPLAGHATHPAPSFGGAWRRVSFRQGLLFTDLDQASCNCIVLDVTLLDIIEAEPDGAGRKLQCFAQLRVEIDRENIVAP